MLMPNPSQVLFPMMAQLLYCVYLRIGESLLSLKFRTLNVQQRQYGVAGWKNLLGMS